MTKIERRSDVVTLYQGRYQRELDALSDRAFAALRDEESGVKPQRASTKSEATRLAKEWELLRAEADETAVRVVLNEISNTEWQQLADKHPPREGDEKDKRAAVNMATFPAALLRKSLATDLDLGDLSRAHYVKLETAAWNLHNEDDALPLSSLGSQLTQLRDRASRQPSDSESARSGSTAGSRPKRTSSSTKTETPAP